MGPIAGGAVNVIVGGDLASGAEIDVAVSLNLKNGIFGAEKVEIEAYTGVYRPSSPGSTKAPVPAILVTVGLVVDSV